MIIKNIFVLIFGAGICFLYPAYSFLRGDRPYIFPIEFIGVDELTTHGYYITVGIQLSMSLTAVMSLVAMDIFLVEVISVFSLGNELVSLNCRLLSAMCEKGNTAKLRVQQTLFLRNVIAQIQDNDK